MRIIITLITVYFWFVSAATCQGSEQKVVWVVESYALRGETTEEKCQWACNLNNSDTGRLEQFLSDGWEVISATSREVACIEDWAPLPNLPIAMGCTGRGTEYVLLKPDSFSEAEGEATSREPMLLQDDNDL